ncbi:hypothetical protein LCGC14_2145690 [marine sediment metagenome]|uniref:Uncharacterized protein n=1 Tax=marine sediment metagenome TaxID=412755 RepID=A0A0F9EJB0_9ZZZZ
MPTFKELILTWLAAIMLMVLTTLMMAAWCSPFVFCGWVIYKLVGP